MENSDSEVKNMSQNVMITGAGKAVGLGFNMVLRYLEAGEGNTKYMK
jgi:NAD(P)-dependent dehydrogenase (short-subunit alcohol dehydrogenase family)